MPTATPESVRPLSSPVNPGTGLPWRCVTHEAHECSGPVVGALGAVPVCAAGAVAEQAARDASAASLARFTAANADLLAAEARAEARLEGRVS